MEWKRRLDAITGVNCNILFCHPSEDLCPCMFCARLMPSFINLQHAMHHSINRKNEFMQVPFAAFRKRLRLRHPSATVSGLVLFAAIAGASASAQTAPPSAPVTPAQEKLFEASIRPVLSEKCYSCHSATDQRAGLRLDSREAILKGGAHGPAINLTDPDKSLILQAISYNGKLQMPPAGKLRPAELAAFTAWIKMGAPWPAAKSKAAAAGQAAEMVITDSARKFWSFVPVRKAALPKVSNPAWASNPVDRFILSGLDAHHLKPAPTADRKTLIRRVSVDLTGVVPTPAEVEAFVNDKAPDAWAKVVDRLLASPRYGERWGRHWLDLVRYADSNGLDENVAFANAYRYRDYVVNAFNADKPYSTFITEQLAGDLMTSRDDVQRNDRLVATGFLELGPKVLAEPDKDKLVMDIVDEQIDVASKAFIGLTISCARCHNHKFDPIPTRDYYAMAGIFKSTRTMETLNTVAMWRERQLSNPQFAAEKEAHQQKLADARKGVQEATARGNDALKAEISRRSEDYLLAGWMASRSMLRSLAESKENLSFKSMIEAETFTKGSGIAKDFETYGKGIGVIHTVGQPSTAEWNVEVPAAGMYQVELRYASAEARPVKLLLNGKVIRESTAGAITGSFQPEGQRWEPQGVFEFKAGVNTIRIERNESIPHFDRLFVVSPPVNTGEVVSKTPEQIAAERNLNAGLVFASAAVVGGIPSNPEKLSAAERSAEAAKLAANFKSPDHAEKFFSPENAAALKSAEDKLKAVEAAAPQAPMAMAAEEGKVEDCRIHIRGDTQSLGDSVDRHFLTVLNGDKNAGISKQQSGRLELAAWLTRPENPLTARVAVNRIWQEHFGSGLSKTPDNFGLLGDRPSNQPLLDWLAATFMEQGWSFKKIHRLLLTSNTYKQSCNADAITIKKAETADPDNRLLWRMDRRRMDADAFRDSILEVAGTLDDRMGGSLLMTKNHDYVTNDQSANAAVYDSPRRSLYLPIIRNALYDMFQAFDMGDPSMVNAVRSSTTVTPQALFIMNSPFALTQSKTFAQSLQKVQGATDAARISEAYMRAYGRKATAAETAKALKYISRYSDVLAAKQPDATARKNMAWASWCQVLLATNAFIYLD